MWTDNDVNVIFQTTKPATGEAGDNISTADAGVVIEGGLVVREKVFAEEFQGNGLGAGIGAVVMWGGPVENIPDNHLLCDGRALPVGTPGSPFYRLWEAIGYIHGGSGPTFNLPDLSQRFIVGAEGGNNPSVPGVDEPYPTGLAGRGGQNSVALSVEELATHTHGPTNPQGQGQTSNVNLAHTHGAGTYRTANATTPNNNSPVTSTFHWWYYYG